MKFVAKYVWLLLLAVVLLPTQGYAQDDEGSGNDTNDDNTKLLRRNWSLFSEAYKMNDFTTARKYGWAVHEMTTTRFKTLHPKMINMYDSLWARATDPAVKAQMADTVFLLINEAIQLFPDKKDKYVLQRGYMYERLFEDKKAEAIADYEEGIHNDYQNGDLWYLNRLAVLYGENTETKANAIAVLQAILLREPNSEFAQGMMKSLVSDPEEYVGLLRDAYYADSENMQKLYELANGYYEQLRNYDSAQVYFDVLVKKEPGVKNYWERLAASLMYLGKYDPAISAYKEVTNLDPANKESWINLARAQKEVGRLQDARSSAEKALELVPDWGAPHMLIGQVYEAAAVKCVEGTRGGWDKMKIQDKAVYSLAQDEYRKAARDSEFADQARSRIGQLSTLVPTAEDLFRNGIKKGSSYSLNSGCYSWINRSTVLSY